MKQKILFGIIVFFFLMNLLFPKFLVKPISHFLKDGVSILLQKEISVEEITSIKEEELRKEIEEYKELLSLNKTLEESSYVNASTIYRTLEETILIDKGYDSGIEIGMPVITQNGLLGRVIDTSKYSSTVELLTVNHSKISVKIKVEDTYLYGILNSKFQIEGISSNLNIPEGSIVTTTGMGEYYPSGILIGTTKQIEKDHFDLTKVVSVESKVNFYDIPVVTALKKELKE